MKRYLLAGVAAAALSTGALAAPLTLTGNFVQVGVSDVGTLGSNGSTPPGMRHDPTGTGNFTPGGIANDYLTPGSPHEGFGINSTQTGFRAQSNSGGGSFSFSAPSLTSVSGYSLAATQVGTLAGFLNVTHTYFFNPNDERVNVTTTLTALTNLTNLAFARSVDPDPDVNRFGNFDTINSRGNGTIAPQDLVSSRGAVSGLFLAILNLLGTTYERNTSSNNSCCSVDDPNTTLVGSGATFPGTNTGDLGLEMAWRIGNLAAGSSATISYAYVFGSRIEDVVVDPGTTPVPEPGTLALFGLGLVGLAAARRRRREG